MVDFGSRLHAVQFDFVRRAHETGGINGGDGVIVHVRRKSRGVIAVDHVGVESEIDLPVADGQIAFVVSSGQARQFSGIDDLPVFQSFLIGADFSRSVGHETLVRGQQRIVCHWRHFLFINIRRPSS